MPTPAQLWSSLLTARNEKRVHNRPFSAKDHSAAVVREIGRAHREKQMLDLQAARTGRHRPGTAMPRASPSMVGSGTSPAGGSRRRARPSSAAASPSAQRKRRPAQSPGTASYDYHYDSPAGGAGAGAGAGAASASSSSTRTATRIITISRPASAAASPAARRTKSSKRLPPSMASMARRTMGRRSVSSAVVRTSGGVGGMVGGGGGGERRVVQAVQRRSGRSGSRTKGSSGFGGIGSIGSKSSRPASAAASPTTRRANDTGSRQYPPSSSDDVLRREGVIQGGRRRPQTASMPILPPASTSAAVLVGVGEAPTNPFATPDTGRRRRRRKKKKKKKSRGGGAGKGIKGPEWDRPKSPSMLKARSTAMLRGVLEMQGRGRGLRDDCLSGCRGSANGALHKNGHHAKCPNYYWGRQRGQRMDAEHLERDEDHTRSGDGLMFVSSGGNSGGGGERGDSGGGGERGNGGGSPAADTIGNSPQLDARELQIARDLPSSDHPSPSFQWAEKSPNPARGQPQSSSFLVERHKGHASLDAGRRRQGHTPFALPLSLLDPNTLHNNPRGGGGGWGRIGRDNGNNNDVDGHDGRPQFDQYGRPTTTKERNSVVAIGSIRVPEGWGARAPKKRHSSLDPSTWAAGGITAKKKTSASSPSSPSSPPSTESKSAWSSVAGLGSKAITRNQSLHTTIELDEPAAPVHLHGKMCMCGMSEEQQKAKRALFRAEGYGAANLSKRVVPHNEATFHFRIEQRVRERKHRDASACRIQRAIRAYLQRGGIRAHMEAKREKERKIARSLGRIKHRLAAAAWHKLHAHWEYRVGVRRLSKLLTWHVLGKPFQAWEGGRREEERQRELEALRRARRECAAATIIQVRIPLETEE